MAITGYAVRRIWFVIIVLFIISQFVLPLTSVEAQRTCAIDWYDTSTDPYTFLYNERNESICDFTDPLLCPPGSGVAGNIATGDLWCTGGGLPDPPPNYPGINAGRACLAGTTRTVNITPTGDSHDLQISPSNVIIALSGTSYTFIGLQENVAYRFRARAENGAGSSGWSSWTATVQQDESAPTTTLDLVGTAGNNDWWTSDVSVTLPATDKGCLGVSDTFYTLDTVASTYTGTAFTVSGEGTHDLDYYSTDGTHDETVQQASIAIDTIPPTLSLSPDRSPDTLVTGWWNDAVTITVTASDATSTVDTIDTNLNGAGWSAYTTAITIATDGTHTLDARAYDMAGWETVDGLQVSIDMSDPYLGFVFEREPDHNGWYNDSVSVAVETSDGASGVYNTVARLSTEPAYNLYEGAYILGGNGEYVLEAAVTDNAGNVTARQVTVPIDISPPTTTLTWDGSALTIDTSDNLSGVMGVTLSINEVVTTYLGEPLTFDEAGIYTIEAYSTDMAGNDEGVQTLTIDYDPTALVSAPLSPPTLTGELSCEAGEYAVTGFASASGGLSAVYLLAQTDTTEAFEVANARYDYTPASTDVEAAAFYYTPQDETEYTLTLVAEDALGNTRQRALACDTEAVTTLLVDIPPQGAGEIDSPDDETSAYINRYPSSLGDMTGSVPTGNVLPAISEPRLPEMAISTNAISASAPSVSNYTAPDTTVTVLEPAPTEVRIVEGRATNLSAEDLATILSVTGLLATATAAVGIQVSDTARRRREELEAERLAAEDQRQKDLEAQAERARENAEMNAQMREDAQKEVFIDVEVSDAYKAWQAQIDAIMSEYYARIERGQQILAARQQEQMMAFQAVSNLALGSTIADLPQDIQTIFWELGNMSLEYAQHHNEETGESWHTNVADGQWAFQDKERRNLGFYQYLIRTAAAEGDMQAVIEHTQNAASYIGKTLVDRIDREMAYTADTALHDVQREQARVARIEPHNLLDATEAGLTHSAGAINRRGTELNKEMVLRDQSHMTAFVDFQVNNQRGNNAATILQNHQVVEAQYAVPAPVINTVPVNTDALQYADITVPAGQTTDPKTGESMRMVTTLIDNGGGGNGLNYPDEESVEATAPMTAENVASVAGALTVNEATRGTFVDLVDFANMDSDLARLAQLEILDMLSTTLSSDVGGIAIAAYPDADNYAEGWSDEQIAEAYAGISLTVDALTDLARNGGVSYEDLSGTVTDVYNNWVGPTEIRLIDDTGLSNVRDEYGDTQWHWGHNEDRHIEILDTVWRPDSDDNLILLPQDFHTNANAYGESQGQWLLVGELGLAINNRAFGLMTHNLTETGIETEDRTTSGNDNTFLIGRDWVYDEQGIFNFATLGGPSGSDRYNYSNDNPDDEIRDMFKQWVFLNDFLGDNDFQTSEDLIAALAGSQGYLTEEPNPNMTEADPYDAQRILGVANMLGIELTDEERAFYAQWSRGNNILELEDSYQIPRTLEIETALRQELGIDDNIPMNFDGLVDYYIHRYDEERPMIDTFFERHAFMDMWLSQSYATSTLWREREFQLRMLNDFAITHDNILEAPEQTERFTAPDGNTENVWDATLRVGQYEDDERNVFGGMPTERIDLRSYRDMTPTEYMQMYRSQRDTTFSLLSLTDWANPFTQINTRISPELGEETQRTTHRDYHHSVDHYELSAYYPPGLQAMSSGQLSQLWSNDMPREAIQTLETTMRTYDSLYPDGNYPEGYDMFGFATGDNDPTVLNYNALGLMMGGAIVASIAYEPVDWLVSGADSVAMLLNGNVIGATANAALAVAPGALGTVRHVVGTGADIARGVGQTAARYGHALVQGTPRVLRQTLTDMGNDVRWFIRQLTGSDGRPIYALVDNDGNIYQYSDNPYILMSRSDDQMGFDDYLRRENQSTAQEWDDLLNQPPDYPEIDNTRPLSSNQYTVIYEIELPPNVPFSGESRPRHFQRSNEILYNAMVNDPNLRITLENEYPGIFASVSPGSRGAFPRNPPPGFSWHHVTMQYGPTGYNSPPGVMQLISRTHHQSPGNVQSNLHPLPDINGRPNQVGGYGQWG